jgi:serine/threonine protein phosphatase PrpC
MFKIMCTGISDLGLKRSNNEDTFVLKPEMGLLCVADGMGGAAAGEVASRIFAETAVEVFSRPGERSEQGIMEDVQQVFMMANERILDHVRVHPRDQGMGCTAELIVFSDDHYVLGHVGDSRTYLWRQEKLRQLTRDHSLVQDQVDQGLITEEEARRHALRNVILRAVGTEETLAVDLIRGKPQMGDVFLLCSDGLTDMIDDQSVQDTLTLPLNLAQKLRKLIESAKTAGGHDNITVVLCQIIP